MNDGRMFALHFSVFFESSIKTWFSLFDFFDDVHQIYKSIQSYSQTFKIYMQNRLGNIKNHQPKYRYELPLKSQHPQTKRSDRTAVSNALNIPQPMNQKAISSHLKVLQPEEYVTLQMSLAGKLKNLQDNVKVCQQKSKLKDKEMQTLAEVISKLSLKTLSEQKKVKKKERQLQKISIKCQELTSDLSGGQQKINKEAVYLHQQTNKYSSLQELVVSLEEAMRQAHLQLQRKKQICLSLESLKQENQDLRQHYSQLVNEEKLIQYRQNHDRSECSQMQKKKEQLEKVLKDRNRINKNNQIKLNKLTKEVEAFQMGLNRSEINQHQISEIELEIGDLNQQLLFINDEISEFQFKIKRKHHQNEELKTKLFYTKQQTDLPVQSGQKEDTMKKGQEKKHNSKSVTLSKQGQGVNQLKSSPKGAELAHATPTFPSNISNQMYFNSEPPRGQLREESHSEEVNRNIQKLIKRYYQIGSKDKNL